MQHVRKSLFSKFVIGMVTTAFCLNSSGIAFAAGNLKRPAAKKKGAPELGDELIRTHLMDGGKATESQIIHNKRNLGANAVLGPSAAMTRAAADAKDIPLFQYIAQYLGNHPDRKKFTPEDFLKAVRNVNIISNVINGGAHAKWSTDNQEYMVDPGFDQEMAAWMRMECLHQISIELNKILESPADLTKILGREILEPFPTGKADEGGVAPRQFRNNEEPLKVLTVAIDRAEKKLGLKKGTIKISLDFAISDLYKEDGMYHFKAEKDPVTGEALVRTTEQVIGIEEGWLNGYDIASLEDGIAERDPKGWAILTDRVGQKILVIGDDFTYTNLEKLLETIKNEQINTILIKINQNGSISGTIQVIQHALLNGISVAISHRSGETEDDFIAHLAIAANLFEKKPDKFGRMPMVLLKTGAFRQSDRVAKYNTLLRVEAYLERLIAGLVPAINQPGLSPTTIIDVYGLEIYDSRGNPTTETVVTLNNGKIFRNAVPSGASTGENESIELRDKAFVEKYPFRITEEFVRRVFPYNPEITVEKAKKILSERVSGKGVQVAVYNINYLIAPKLIGKDVAEIDSLEKLIELGDGEMFKLELALEKEAQEYAAKKSRDLTVAIVGGAPKAGVKKQGIGSGWFLRGKNIFNMRGGSRSDHDPANNIYRNKESVIGAQIVQIATPASVAGQLPLKAWKDTIFNKEQAERNEEQTGFAQNLEKGAIVVVMGNALAPQDQKALADEGFTSLGELTQALINEVVPEKGIKVVESFNNAPGEWVTFLDYQFEQDVIAVGDDQKACQLVIDNYINNYPGLKGVYGGPLANGKYLEYLTMLIIKSKKTLLLGEPLKKLFDYIIDNKDKVSYEKEKLAEMVKGITAFNQPAFDAQINKILTNPQVVLNYVESLKGTQRYEVPKEIISILLRGYAERIKDSDSKTCNLITKTCDECDAAMLIDREGSKTARKAPKTAPGALTAEEKRVIRGKIESTGTEFISAMPLNIKGIIAAVKKYAVEYGALVFKAETILNNVGGVTMLRIIKDAGLPVKVVVWTDDANEAAALEIMGVNELADVKQTALKNVFSELKDDKGVLIPAEQIVAIGFAEENELPSSAQGVTVFNLQAPEIKEKGESFINDLPLVIAKALTKLSKSDEVKNIYEESSASYFVNDNINELQLSQFNDLKAEYFEVPLIKVNEEVAKIQNAYDAVMTAI